MTCPCLPLTLPPLTFYTSPDRALPSRHLPVKAVLRSGDLRLVRVQWLLSPAADEAMECSEHHSNPIMSRMQVQDHHEHTFAFIHFTTATPL